MRMACRMAVAAATTSRAPAALRMPAIAARRMPPLPTWAPRPPWASPATIAAAACRRFASAAPGPSSFYSVLGIDQDASKKEIKAKFYELSMKYHPDRNLEDESAHARFLAINEAYSVLGDDLKRRDYDREMAWGSTVGSGASASASPSQRTTSQAAYANIRRRQRERLRPDDWVQYKRMADAYGPRGPHFDYKTHTESHYNPAEYQRWERKFRIKTLKSAFESSQRDWNFTATIMIGFLLVLIVNFGVIQLLF